MYFHVFMDQIKLLLYIIIIIIISGPTGLPGFCRRISTPFPMSKVSWCSSASLNIAAIAGAIRSAVLFSRSVGR